MSVFKLPVNWQYAVILFLLPVKSPPSGGLGGHYLHKEQKNKDKRTNYTNTGHMYETLGIAGFVPDCLHKS